MFYLRHFDLNKRITNTSTFFIPNYIRSAENKFFRWWCRCSILLIRQTEILQIYERDSGSWMSHTPSPLYNKADIVWTFLNIKRCVKRGRIRSYSVRIFPHSDWMRRDMKYQSKCGKMRNRITSNMDTFHAVKFIHSGWDTIQLRNAFLNVTHLGWINFDIQRKSIQYLLYNIFKTSLLFIHYI